MQHDFDLILDLQPEVAEGVIVEGRAGGELSADMIHDLPVRLQCVNLAQVISHIVTAS
jgi:hypothetical protein